MDGSKEISVFLGLFTLSFISLWLWYSHIVLFGTGFVIAMTFCRRNLPIKAGKAYCISKLVNFFFLILTNSISL